MNVAETAASFRAALAEALRAHEARAREPWSGVYHFREENERIGQVIRLIDPFLHAVRRWPEERRYIGNDERLRILGEIAEVEIT